MNNRVLVHLAAGVGNVVLATPLLVALHELGLQVHLLLDADYAETIELLRPWGVLDSVHAGRDVASVPACDIALPAVPPFYWPRFRRPYRATRIAGRPPDSLFWSNEQRWYLAFAHALGASPDTAPSCTLPIGPSPSGDISLDTVVIAPGCKTGEMARKRWPHFAVLAERFDDVAIVGTPDDDAIDGRRIAWPAHVRSLVGALTLRETAETLAAAGVVLANDSGLAHVAAAVGTSTVMLFGPTPDASLGTLPPNVTVLRSGLECQPCWFSARFAACGGRITCLQTLAVDHVEAAVRSLLGAGAGCDALRTSGMRSS